MFEILQKKNNQWSNYTEEKILLGNNFEISNPQKISQNMMDLKSVVPYNKTFWENFNVISE